MFVLRDGGLYIDWRPVRLETLSFIIVCRFMFFSGGSDKQKRGKEFLVLLPGKQQLTPGYWTMQLMVTDITNGSNDSGSGIAIPHYLTRYRTNLDLSARNGSESPITEKRCALFRTATVDSLKFWTVNLGSKVLFFEG